MDALSALISGLDGLSVAIGLIFGLIVGVGFVLLTRFSLNRAFQKALEAQKESFSSLSSEALKSNQESFLSLANDKLGSQTQQHSAELEKNKELIDQQLVQMSDTLKTVPTELEKNQRTVSETIEKSAKSLEASNKTHLTQLKERSDTQTREHIAKLDEKELLINRRLSEMDDKLGKVQKLIDEFEKARESKLGALDDQLKNLTQTTSSLQKALADNRARGQWGERIAEDILQLLGFIEGVNYRKQTATETGRRPDFTFLLPNQLSLNMDAKFPLDNYLRYIEADSEAERQSYRERFLSDVYSRVTEIQKRGYISADTLDCVLVFIPNEQVYRFIHEQDYSVIDNAMRQKVILCSPLTLYIVLAVIRQAAQNFNVEQKSREIVGVVNEIRKEWDNYTGEMETLQNHFHRVHEKFHEVMGKRTKALDRRFNKIEGVMESGSLPKNEVSGPRQLPF